jgi:hypothetical protein
MAGNDLAVVDPLITSPLLLRERARVRGKIEIWHPHLIPLPSRERMFETAGLPQKLALTTKLTRVKGHSLCLKI